MSPPGSDSASPPNVIVIMTDDQRPDTAAFMPIVQQEIVAKGLSYANAFVTSPSCCPSRASFLTGQYAHTTGVLTNIPPRGGALRFVGADAGTVATRLQAAGYVTAYFGKYLNGYADQCSDTHCYVPPGWTRWVVVKQPKSYGYQLSVDGPLLGLGATESDYLTDVLREHALAFLDANPTRSVFVVLATFAPHGEDFLAQPIPAARHGETLVGATYPTGASYLEADVSDKPNWVQSLSIPGRLLLRGAESRWQRQLAALRAVDEAVGAILAKLESQKRLHETVVIFTSDNGFSFGEHRWFAKDCPYEHCLRVPLFVRYDALLDGQPQVRPEIALNIDVVPTIYRLTGVPNPASTEGMDLWAVREGTDPSRTQFLFEHWNQSIVHDPVPDLSGCRTLAHKYVVYATGEEELYDLLHDPDELDNIIGDHRELVPAMRECIRESGGTVPGFPPPDP